MPHCPIAKDDTEKVFVSSACVNGLDASTKDDGEGRDLFYGRRE